MGVRKFFSVEYQGGVNFRGIEFTSWVRNMIADKMNMVLVCSRCISFLDGRIRRDPVFM
jgi:hypothetical protein